MWLLNCGYIYKTVGYNYILSMIELTLQWTHYFCNPRLKILSTAMLLSDYIDWFSKHTKDVVVTIGGSSYYSVASRPPHAPLPKMWHPPGTKLQTIGLYESLPSGSFKHIFTKSSLGFCFGAPHATKHKFATGRYYNTVVTTTETKL